MSHSIPSLVPVAPLSAPHLGAAHLKSLVIALTSPFVGNSTNSRREIVRPIVDDIVDSGQRPEQMLKEFKALLNEASLRARIPFGSESTSILERYITVFIEELYRSGRISEDGARRGKTVDGPRSANTPRSPAARP
jgi:hypothetical protein